MNARAVLSGTGLAVPEDFTANHFEGVYKGLHAHSQKKNEYELAIGAMHAISYRFVALAEYDTRFTASITTHGPGPELRTRYEQERDLFGFFSNAFSIFDTFCFALFAIGALTGESSFPLAVVADERKVNWMRVKAAYQAAFPTERITTVIVAMEADPVFVAIRETRNMFTHRATPPRQYVLGASSSTRIARVNVLVDDRTTSTRRQEVARLLRDGLQAAETFVPARL